MSDDDLDWIDRELLRSDVSVPGWQERVLSNLTPQAVIPDDPEDDCRS